VVSLYKKMDYCKWSPFGYIKLERWIGKDLQDAILLRWRDEIRNYEIFIVSELEITKHPFPQKLINNFTNISIKKIKKNL